MSYQAIGEALFDMVSEVTGLSNVFSRMPKSLQDYPCAAILADGHKNSFADTATNKRTYRFRVLLFYRTDNSETAEATLRQATDSIIEAIEADVTLDGSCDFATPTGAQWAFVERESPLRSVEIVIEANKREFRAGV